MSDDLVKRLLADKLELEVRNRELALQVIGSEGQAQEAYERQVELEAKLAKAVEALAWCSIYEESEVATTTLAELKGEDE